MQNLVIVESPTKARTLSRFLGKDYRIEASMGHIRDLPKASLGIDIANNFNPEYVIPRDKRKKVNELKKIAKDAKNLWLATDPDREGEAIAWHLATLLQESRVQNPESRKGKKQTKVLSRLSTLDPSSIRRVVFHEITQEAIEEAFKHPRELDLKLVDAQQARRVLDRLVGYKLSPLLWEKVKKGLSAGRVQSVALRLIVEREREILAFLPVEYWSIEALLEATNELSGQRSAVSGQRIFTAALIQLNGKKLEIRNGEQATYHTEALKKADYSIEKIIQREVKRNPYPPFTTSTLQQTAGNQLGFSAKKTMMLAQNLYEQGYITYMRTDSVNLSAQALAQARAYIKDHYKSEFLPPAPRQFRSKVKNAQEAHEAIRPANLATKPENLEGTNITRDHKRLYELIWKRTLASQMAEAILKQTTVDVLAACHPERSSEGSRDSSPSAQNDKYVLRASGSVIKFEGWLTLYGKTSAEEDEKDDPKEQILPELHQDEPLKLLNLDPQQHFTEPAPRFSESSLVKKMEELGIGRPSTYAPILSTIQDRYYVEKLDKKFTPTPLGMAVNDFLMAHFPETFDYAFTAEMEESLDEISRGEKEWKSLLSQVYTPMEKRISTVKETAQKVKLEVETTDKICPDCGKPLVVRTGRFGKFLACSGYPECKHTEQMDDKKIDAKCPEDGGDIVIRRTKRGKIFYGCQNYPNCKYATWTKPKS